MKKQQLNYEPDMERLIPAIDPEDRQDQLICLATGLAEKQMREGTASSQVITHYLKLGAERERARVELEILRAQRELVVAKTEQIQSQKKNDELYAQAIAAFQDYSGRTVHTEEDEDFYD